MGTIQRLHGTQAGENYGAYLGKRADLWFYYTSLWSTLLYVFNDSLGLGIYAGPLGPVKAEISSFYLLRGRRAFFFPANPLVDGLPVRIILGCKLPPSVVESVKVAARLGRQRL